MQSGSDVDWRILHWQAGRRFLVLVLGCKHLAAVRGNWKSQWMGTKSRQVFRIGDGLVPIRMGSFRALHLSCSDARTMREWRGSWRGSLELWHDLGSDLSHLLLHLRPQHLVSVAHQQTTVKHHQKNSCADERASKLVAFLLYTQPCSTTQHANYAQQTRINIYILYIFIVIHVHLDT